MTKANICGVRSLVKLIAHTLRDENYNSLRVD